MDNYINYYDILGVDKNATKNQILLKGENLIHYISNDEAFEMDEEEKKKNISNIEKAMAILSNDELRSKHDKFLESHVGSINSSNVSVDSIKTENQRKISELRDSINSKIDELEKEIDDLNNEKEKYVEAEIEEEVSDNRWSEQDLETIKDLYEQDEIDTTTLNRSVDDIKKVKEEVVVDENIIDSNDDSIFKDNDLDEYGNSKWAAKDIFILTHTYGFYTAEYIAQMIDKDVHDVEMMASQLGLTKNGKKNTKAAKVVKVEEDTKDRDQVKKEIKGSSRDIIAAAIILGIGIATCATIIAINNKNKKSENIEVEEPTNTYTTEINDDNQVEEVEESSEIIFNTPEEVVEEVEEVEEVQENDNDYTQTVEIEEPIVQEQQTTNRNQLVENIKSKIDNLPNKNLVTDIDIDVVNALVDYANGEKVIPNTYAYDKFQELTKAGFDISEFFKNTDSYNNVNALATKLANIVEDKGNYDDEYRAYQQIRESVNNIKNNYFPEAVAISAMIDYKVNLNSMVIARGGANDGISDAEKGKDYKNEMDAAASHSNECLNIFNEVDISNSNSILTQIICRAAEEDENRSLSRN